MIDALNGTILLIPFAFIVATLLAAQSLPYKPDNWFESEYDKVYFVSVILICLGLAFCGLYLIFRGI